VIFCRKTKKKGKIMLNYTKEGVRVYLFLENRYTNKDDQQTVKLCVYSGAKSKYFQTGVKVSAEDWEQLSITKKKELVEKRKVLESTFYKYKKVVDRLLEKNNFSFDNIERQLGVSESLLLKDCFENRVKTLRSNNQFSTANNYELALKTFREYDSRNLDLKQITVDWLKKYERFMLETNRGYTTIGMYVRDLRAIMNEAILQGTLDNSFYPFGRGKYEIPSSEGRKLALPLNIIKQIYYYESPTDPTIAKYKDLWMFSYLCNGANFNDILRLKFKNINGNEISFFTRKNSHNIKKEKTGCCFFDR
jgi:hypothetical protein